MNKATVSVYNRYFRDYIRNTPQTYTEIHKPMLSWIDSVLGQLPKNARIFEIGSATPRDARYMRGKGYHVQCSDACPNFVDYLREHGEDAREFNALSDSIPKGYDMIFANAVFPHFTDKDLYNFLAKAFEEVDQGCLIAFDLKQGNGHTWIVEKMPVGRYIQYWQPEQIKDMANSIGFETIYLKDAIPGERPHELWINVGLRRP